MKILYIGDIMGRPGRQTVKRLLPDIISGEGVDFVVAQGENLSDGKGMQVKAVEDMLASGVDFFTGGNWTAKREEIVPWLKDPGKPVTGPANMVEMPGPGFKIVDTAHGKLLFISLLGQIVGYIHPEIENPLKTVDKILDDHKHEKFAAIIVNFHGDYASEKLVIGQYLDGRVSAVIGDHWHVPTADARVLPGGTAHITDVGMAGSRDSSLGVKTQVIVERWLTENPSRNVLETEGVMQFCALLIEINPSNGQAKAVKQLLKFV